MATGKMTANCRWGPGTAYLVSGVALHEDELATVDGRNNNLSGAWYWIQIEGTAYHCWVHSSTVTINGDPNTLPYIAASVPTTDSVPPPANVQATRSEDNVTITWNAAPSAPELGYLIEATVCIDGYRIGASYSTTATAYTLRDDGDCSKSSSGTLRTFNKLGYSNGVTIPWP